MTIYHDFFRANAPIKDKPMTIYHIEKHDKFFYLGNTYNLVLELDDDEDFMRDNALFHLSKKKYPSRTVEFLGNGNMVEAYFLKNDELECFSFKLINDKKVKID